MINDILPLEFNELKTVWHLADLHIRNIKRHKEYREVFQRVYDEIRKDTKNAVAVVAGDIVHAKLEMSPELLDLVFEFFENLSEILPVIVITGNHDCNLNNPSRMDVLYPILKRIRNNNIFYLKNSGIYDVADTKFVVMSVFQEPSEYIRADQVDGNTKIALYHGTVQNAVSETGFKLHNDNVSKKTFKGYDIVLLGDIHKRQAISNYNSEVGNPQANFPGSIIQQNFGEDVEHGMLKWNVSKRKAKFIPIANDYAYITLHVKDGEMPDIESLHPKSRIRLMIKNTLSARVTEIKALMREKYPKLQDINDIKIPDGSLVQDGININKVDTGNARDVSFQNTIIQEFLLRRYTIDNEVIEKIYDINDTLNLRLKPVDVQRNIVWKPKTFEFTNMFSYGGGNKIDFNKLSGIVGLFAPNRTGKSNFIEALCFSIFDKSPRALKSDSAMNNKKNSFRSKFLYDIGNKEFRIKREGTRKKTGDVVVKTDFSVKNTEGERKSLNGERRSSTNLVIRNYLGDYESFIMTALIPQIDLHKGNNSNLINMRQSDRKALLNRFLDLTVFQELYDLARDEMKTVEVKLDDFGKREFSKELAHANIQIKLLTGEYKKTEDKKEELDDLYKNINKKINILTSTLVNIDIENTDITMLESDKLERDGQIRDVKKTLVPYVEMIENLEKDIQSIQLDLDNIDTNIIEKYKLVEEIEKQQAEAQHNIDKYQIKIDTKRQQLGDYSQLVFDPTCGKCDDNKVFVEDKMETEDDIAENETIVSTFKQQFDNFNQMLDRAKHVRDQYTLFLSLREQLSGKNGDYSIVKNEKITSERKRDNLQYELDAINNDIELYHKNKQTIEKNKLIQTSIDEWEQNATTVNDKTNEVTNELMRIYSDLELNKNKKQRIEDEIAEVKHLEIQSLAYKYYMEAVEKDGVPFDLIVKTMPIIEHEVNNILAQMVDFQIIFNIDEQGKDIEPKIVYDEDNVWAVELVSGMERFITSIAIRVALLSVSSLPRPNFLVIDEGFGSLDSENSNNLYRLFEYLKTQFDFVIIISHLDYIKDFIDQHIELKSEDGFSKIVL